MLKDVIQSLLSSFFDKFILYLLKEIFSPELNYYNDIVGY